MGETDISLTELSGSLGLFDGAEFGDKFLTRDGKVAVYVHAPTAGGATHTLMIEGNAAPFSFTVRGEFFSGVKTKRDILGKLKCLDGYPALDLEASAFASSFALDRYNKKLKEQTLSNETGTKQE